MKFNWFYFLVALLFATMIVVTIRFFHGSGHGSVGIAYSSEYRITAEKPALVKAIPVVPGQQVKQGQLLAELTSADLEINIEKLNHRISILKSELLDKGKLASSEIELVRAESGISIEEINSKIQETEGELNLNRRLSASIQMKSDSSIDHPVVNRIKALGLQKEKHQAASAIRVRDILQENETEQRILSNQIEILERELALLFEEKKKLSKYASAPGVIEKIFVRQDEQVDGFSPLMSVNPLHPSMVTGYLVGRKENLPVGSAVRVSSYDRPKEVVGGTVIGYGAVVALPEILQKATAIKAFGREIFIEVAAENTLASGEKVLIK